MKLLLAIISASFFSFVTLKDLHRQKEFAKERKPETIENLSRSEQIQRCASCHPKQYENEMLGPHAASYTKLMANVKHVRTSSNFTEDWKKAVITEFENCLTCHAADNVYESVYSEIVSETDETKFTAKHYPEIKTSALPKRGDDLLSGVDCLTCHMKGTKVLTTSSFKPSGIIMEGQCDVLPSKFFSTDMNCSMSCHRNLYKQTNENIKDGLVKTIETNCIKCHQEYDENGEGTHYYFWKHDHPDKRKNRPEKHTPFACVSISLKQREEGAYVSFEWKNRNAPHGYPNSAEYLVEINLLNSDRETKLLGAERINRKCIEDLNLQHLFKDTIPGIAGYDNYVDTEPLYREYLVNATDINESKILVNLKWKNPYWTKDSEFVILESKVYDLH